MGTGRMSYMRKYDVILLVGLTELKAQIGWIDPETVRVHLVLHVSVRPIDSHTRESRGQRKGL